MKLRKRFIIIFSILGLMGLLGGCHMFEKPSLTKEQQDNVVRWIARGYDVEKVEFISFNQDKKTGIYLLSFRLNDSNNYETTISISQQEEFNKPNGVLGLNPISRFKNLEKTELLDKYYDVDISQIEIVYLGR